MSTVNTALVGITRNSAADELRLCNSPGEWRAFSSWVWMIMRCQNPKSPGYEGYGGRGIYVCERWLDFRNFLDDMGPRPLWRSIGRMDNSRGYEPSNCRWETDTEQNSNKSNSVILDIDGEKFTQSRAAKISGHYDGTICRRLQRGYSPADALNDRKIKKVKLCLEQVDEIRRLIKAGVSDKDIASDYGVTRQSIGNIRRGTAWPIR